MFSLFSVHPGFGYDVIRCYACTHVSIFILTHVDSSEGRSPFAWNQELQVQGDCLQSDVRYSNERATTAIYKGPQ